MLDVSTQQRLFGLFNPYDQPIVSGIVVAIAGVLLVTPLIVWILDRLGRMTAETRAELYRRTMSWSILGILMIGPILLGAVWVILGVGILSILCYRGYARATGFFREKRVSAVVVLGIALVTFAVFDHWYGLFMALGPLVVAIIAAVAITYDQPRGYIQRVAVGIFGFLLFGVGLGHLGYLANDANSVHKQALIKHGRGQLVLSS